MANTPGNPQLNPANLGAVLLAINTGIDRQHHSRDVVLQVKHKHTLAIWQWLRSHVLAVKGSQQLAMEAAAADC